LYKVTGAGMYSYHCSLLKASIPTPTAQCQWSPIPRTDHT